MLKFRPPADLLGSSSSHSSCMSSPSLDSVSEDEETDVGYFKRPFKYTPDSTDYASDAESEGAESDATLDDAAEIFADFGHPLERIPRIVQEDAELSLESCQEFGHGTIYHPGTTCSPWCASLTQSSSSVTSFLTDYHAIVEDLLKSPENPFDELDPQNFVTFDPSPPTSLSSMPCEAPFMIKRTLHDSTELSLFLDLNSADLRQDPWNPCPHILRTVNHDPTPDYLYLCMERLNEFNAPPMTTVAQYIDFFRQTLEGLSFLHEHRLVGFSCSDPNSYMVDLSSGVHSNNASFVSLLPPATSRGRLRETSTPLKHSGIRDHHTHRLQHPRSHPHHHNSVPNADPALFDRSIYPVRYYFVNFTRTRKLQEDVPGRNRTTSTPSPLPSSKTPPSRRPCPFKQDVKDMGKMIASMLADVPTVVSTKFRSLIKAMTVGGFGAEDSRRLFEALARSLEADVFEMSVRRGAGLRSKSVESTPNGAMSGSTYAPSRFRGDFGLEPDTVALSS